MEEVLARAPVVAATLTGALGRDLRACAYDLAVVDEAAQARSLSRQHAPPNPDAGPVASVPYKALRVNILEQWQRRMDGDVVLRLFNSRL